MSEEELVAIEARHAACPPGTWYLADGDDEAGANARWVTTNPDYPFYVERDNAIVALTLYQNGVPFILTDAEPGDPVASFIVNAHNTDILALTAEVRRLQSLVPA